MFLLVERGNTCVGWRCGRFPYLPSPLSLVSPSRPRLACSRVHFDGVAYHQTDFGIIWIWGLGWLSKQREVTPGESERVARVLALHGCAARERPVLQLWSGLGRLTFPPHPPSPSSLIWSCLELRPKPWLSWCVSPGAEVASLIQPKGRILIPSPIMGVIMHPCSMIGSVVPSRQTR
ncbi:hypothetical protein VTI74DRAFT_1374 [Chaetomium olivicolor]